MSQPRWYESGQPELWQAMRYLFGLGRRTVDYRCPPGGYKHRSIEAAEALREEWLAENVRCVAARSASDD